MPAQSSGRARRCTWFTLVVLVAVLAATATLPVQAVDPSPTPDPAALQERLEDLRQRAAQQRAKIGLLDDRQAALASQLDGLAAELAQLEAQVAEARARATEIRTTIERLEVEIGASLARQTTYETAIGQLSRTLYEVSQDSGLDRLLSGDLLGFFTQVAYVDRLTGQLRTQVRALARERAAQEQVVADLGAEQERLAETERLASIREAELNEQAATIEELLDKMAAAEQAARKQYSQTQVAISETSLTLDQALREQAALAAKEAAGTGGGAPPPTPAPEPTAAPTEAPTASPTDTPPGGGPPGTPDPDATATPAPTASPVPTATPTPIPSNPPGTVAFYGRGTDHGVGLSQWGAHGRAKAGQSHQEILAHYYQNTTLGTLSGAPVMRVLVADHIAPTSDRPAKVYGWSGEWSIAGRGGPYPAGAYVTMVPSGSSWRAVVRDGTGAVIADLADAADIMLTPGSDATRFQVWFKPSYYDTYRGSIRLISGGGTVSAVNHVLLELYLLSVVPAESPASWPAAALRAQAIAARSYAYVHRRSSSYNFDVYDDARSQVYLGSLYEKTATNVAVADTAGVVVKYGTAVANTLFHSTAGGWTEHNENVFVSSSGAKLASPVAYLRGVSDRRPDGSSYDSASSKATWSTALYTLSQLSAIFANDSLTNVGTIQSLDLSNRGVSGRLISVTLRGSAATKTVSGPYFKYVFNVYSPVTDPAIWSTLFGTYPIP